MKNSKKAVILYGPPGSGKGTQAKLLADKLGFFHFDTGEYLRTMLHDPKLQKNKIIRKERKLNDSGKLNTPAWVLRIVSRRVEELNKLGQSIIFSGSPRTLFEAFGNDKNKGLIKILENLYGRKNTFVFLLDIPSGESIKRNSLRASCSVCRTPLLANYCRLNGKINAAIRVNQFTPLDKLSKFINCPFCGGAVKRRRDDERKVIVQRLKEYRERTLPIVEKLRERGYRVIKIDGRPLPYKIHEKINQLLAYKNLA